MPSDRLRIDPSVDQDDEVIALLHRVRALARELTDAGLTIVLDLTVTVHEEGQEPFSTHQGVLYRGKETKGQPGLLYPDDA